MSNFLSNTPIEYLKGIGPRKGLLLKNELQIFTYNDLLNLFPNRYIDKSRYYKISEILTSQTEVQIIGKITFVNEIKKGRQSRLIAHLEDENQDTIELIWFRSTKWIKNKLKKNIDYVIFGNVTEFMHKKTISHPEIEPLKEHLESKKSSMQAIYPSTENLQKNNISSKQISKLLQTLILDIYKSLPEILSENILKKNKLLSRRKSIVNIHFPKSIELLERAKFRLKYEELFFIQLSLILKKQTNNSLKGFIFDKIGGSFNNFYKNHMGFELTDAQKKVLKEIRNDFRTGIHSNRLLQGDVGSGKTIVAFLCILMAIDNGFQGCIMAPTEVLASQHFESISEFCDKLELKCELLTGSTKTKKRREIDENLQNGNINILIGTHALIEEKVKFKNLGLAIIDEQHKFGVKQRAMLWRKNTTPPHILVMTATPIPRTLAMSLYGDINISTIDELPKNRKPIKTFHKTDKNRLNIFHFMESEIKKGRQIYVVYPLIEESKNMDFKDLMDGYESIIRHFPQPKYKISIVHGRMKSSDKEIEMNAFAKGETQIMVATTVIEVGVNVPNASVMIIESAERFGLSQLHQIRGRVGRGSNQSYCILVTKDKISSHAKIKINTMVRTNNGFDISEVDLKLRGSGNIDGTAQSGISKLKIANIIDDVDILSKAREDVIEMLNNDPNLMKNENENIKKYYAKIKSKNSWGKIS